MTTEMTEFRGFLGCAVEAMDQKGSEVFLSLCMAEMNGDRAHATAAITDFEEKSWVFKVMISRLTALSEAEISPWALMLIGSMLDTPAKAVLWAYTLDLIYVDNGRKEVTIDTVTKHFPMGFPTEAAYCEIWNSQKMKDAPNGNWIDSLESYPSRGGGSEDE